MLPCYDLSVGIPTGPLGDVSDGQIYVLTPVDAATMDRLHMSVEERYVRGSRVPVARVHAAACPGGIPATSLSRKRIVAVEVQVVVSGCIAVRQIVADPVYPVPLPGCPRQPAGFVEVVLAFLHQEYLVGRLFDLGEGRDRSR